jgi:hypothetical protein
MRGLRALYVMVIETRSHSSSPVARRDGIIHNLSLMIAIGVFTVGIPEGVTRAFRQKLEPDRTSISSASSDVSCVGLTFCRIFFHWNGTLGTVGTSKKALLRFIDRGPGALLERPAERHLERLL